MKGAEKIENELKKKGWNTTHIVLESIHHGPDGREGGWFIELEFDDENCSEEFLDKLDTLEKRIFEDGQFGGSFISGFNIKSVLSIIKEMPHFNQ